MKAVPTREAWTSTAPASSRQSIGIALLVATGIVISLVLLALEIRNGEPLTVSAQSADDAGEPIILEATVTNETDVDRCPDIRGVARDTEARDLAEVTADPVNGEGRIGPGESVTYRAVIAGISDQDRAEKLDDLTIYVYEPHRCDR